jgi:heptosyltransferase-3
MIKLTPKNILVIKFRNIGDVLLTSPLISTLKLEIPEARVCAAVKQGTEAMLEGHPHLDSLYVLPKRGDTESTLGFGLRYLKWLNELRKERFELAINTTEGDRGIILSFLIRAKACWSRPKKNEGIFSWRRLLVSRWTSVNSDRKIHTVLRDLLSASDLVTTFHSEVLLNISPSDQAYIEDRLNLHGYDNNKKLIHIHPSSRWMFKTWPASKLGDLIRHLIDKNYQVAVTSSDAPKEQKYIKQALLSVASDKIFDFSGTISLKQTAALSRKADLFFGVDSAPMHMAAAVGTPIVALFGPSDPRVWGPWEASLAQNTFLPAPEHKPLKHNVINKKEWECVPCGIDGCEGSKKSACLDTINTTNVLKAIENLLAKKSSPDTNSYDFKVDGENLKRLQIKNLLFVITRRIGDTIAITPSIRSAYLHYPNAKITLICKPGLEGIFEQNKYIYQVKSFTAKTAIIGQLYLRKKYELSFIFTENKSFLKLAKKVSQTGYAYTPDNKRNLIHGITYIPRKDKHRRPHIIIENLMVLEPEKITAESYALDFTLKHNERKNAYDKLIDIKTSSSLTICLKIKSHPAKSFRDWPLEHFIKLSALILAYDPNANFIIVGSIEEAKEIEKLTNNFPKNMHPHYRQNLRETASLIYQCDMYIGVDTGITHIAACKKFPIIGLYHHGIGSKKAGPYKHPMDFSLDSPALDGVKDRSHAMQMLSPESVFNAFLNAKSAIKK